MYLRLLFRSFFFSLTSAPSNQKFTCAKCDRDKKEKTNILNKQKNFPNKLMLQKCNCLCKCGKIFPQWIMISPLDKCGLVFFRVLQETFYICISQKWHRVMVRCHIAFRSFDLWGCLIITHILSSQHSVKIHLCF